MKNNRESAQLLLHLADAKIQAIGIARLDAMSDALAYATLRLAAHQMVAATGCRLQTARKHLVRACRRARSSGEPPPKWGGRRTQPRQNGKFAKKGREHETGGT